MSTCSGVWRTRSPASFSSPMKGPSLCSEKRHLKTISSPSRSLLLSPNALQGTRLSIATRVIPLQVLPTIVFFSCVISLLYYLGVMQAVIKRIAYVMQLTMGTSPTESLSCAGNIFVGQVGIPHDSQFNLDSITCDLACLSVSSAVVD